MCIKRLICVRTVFDSWRNENKCVEQGKIKKKKKFIFQTIALVDASKCSTANTVIL